MLTAHLHAKPRARNPGPAPNSTPSVAGLSQSISHLAEFRTTLRTVTSRHKSPHGPCTDRANHASGFTQPNRRRRTLLKQFRAMPVPGDLCTGDTQSASSLGPEISVHISGAHTPLTGSHLLPGFRAKIRVPAIPECFRGRWPALALWRSEKWQIPNTQRELTGSPHAPHPRRPIGDSVAPPPLPRCP